MLYEAYRFFTAQIEKLEKRISDRMAPYQNKVTLLSMIPGVDRIVVWHLIAELGLDMSIFPSAAHCASWAGRERKCRKEEKYALQKRK